MAKILTVRFIRFKEIDSTQRVAREVAGQDADDMTIVWADIQTKGVGRNQKQWFSNEGGLWMTVIIRRTVPSEVCSYIALAVGLSIHELLKTLGIQNQIKYPNDILAVFGRNYRKLCGILCQSVLRGSHVEYVLVGVGLNVNNMVPNMAVSLCELTNKRWDAEALAPMLAKAVSDGVDELLVKGRHVIVERLVSSGCMEIPLDLKP